MFVRKKTGLVLIKGEINSPGYLTFKNDSVKDYINRAGGLTEFAEKKNIFLVYPNGTSIPISTFSSPKVREGSLIVVNQRTISGSGKRTGLETFSIIASQAGNIATTLLSLSLIANQNAN